MREVWLVLATFVAVAAVCYGLIRLSARAQRRGHRVGDVLGAFDEIWNPAAHQPRQTIHAHNDRKAPAPSPGDPPWLGRCHGAVEPGLTTRSRGNARLRHSY